MTARVTATEVRTITGEPVSTAVDLPMLIATTLVDDNLASSGQSVAALKNIELMLAAHFTLLTVENGPLAKKTIGGDTSEGYHQVYKGGLLSTRFGQQAVAMDTSGVLAELSDRAENPSRKTALFSVVGTAAEQNSPIAGALW